MSDWEGPTRWVNTVLLVIVGVIGFDTLFDLLDANQQNVIVGTIDGFAGVLLAPFQDMFSTDDPAALTALVAVLAYSLAAGILLAIIRATQASVPRRRRRDYPDERYEEPYEAPSAQRPPRRSRQTDTDRRPDPPARMTQTPSDEAERTRVVRRFDEENEPTRVARIGEDEPGDGEPETGTGAAEADDEREPRQPAGPTPLRSPAWQRDREEPEEADDSGDDRTQQL
ncbi:MAG: hypothetical protein ACR2MA_09355 [Egibacteraceae bacterium]